MRFKLKTKIFSGIIIIIVLFLATSIYSIYKMYYIANELEVLNSELLPLSKVVTILKTRIKNTQLNFDRIIEEKKRRGENFRFSARLFHFSKFRNKEIKNAMEIVVNAQKKQKRESAELNDIHGKFRIVSRLNDKFSEQLDKIRKLINDNDFDNATLAYNKITTIEKNILNVLDKIEFRLDLFTKKELSKIESNEKQAGFIFLILACVLMLGAVIVGIIYHLSLRPLEKLTQAAKKISKGDFSEQISTHSKDDIGILANEFNKMIIALRERELEIKDHQEKLLESERLAAVGKVASKIAHEIRNPLNSIGLNLEMLAEEINKLGNKKLFNIFKPVTKEIDRLTEITNEYLCYARLPKPKFKEENLAVILSDLTNFIKKEAARKNIDIKLDIPKETPKVLADSNQLRQAFLNILRNSIDAIDDSGEINVNLKTENGNLWVSISDTGAGISEEISQNIFDPFFSTKSTGTGLGLSLTKQIIEEHQGNITCEGKADKGTNFSIKIPIYKKEMEFREM